MAVPTNVCGTGNHAFIYRIDTCDENTPCFETVLQCQYPHQCGGVVNLDVPFVMCP